MDEEKYSPSEAYESELEQWINDSDKLGIPSFNYWLFDPLYFFFKWWRINLSKNLRILLSFISFSIFILIFYFTFIQPLEMYLTQIAINVISGFVVFYIGQIFFNVRRKRRKLFALVSIALAILLLRIGYFNTGLLKEYLLNISTDILLFLVLDYFYNGFIEHLKKTKYLQQSLETSHKK